MSRSAGGLRLAVLATVLVASGLGVLAEGVGAQACNPFVDGVVPSVAARDGTPFAVGILPSECFWSAFDELRVWAGNATHQASRVHDGSGWVSSQNYRDIASFSVAGEWLWVPLKAAPDATHGPVLVAAAEETEVWLRVRTGTGSPVSLSLGVLSWVDSHQVRGGWGAAASPVVALWDSGGSLLAAAPAGIAGDGSPRPPGFAFIAVPEGAPLLSSPPVAPRDLLVVRVAPALRPEGSLFELVVNEGLSDLEGLRVVSRGGAIALPSFAVAPGDVVRFVSSVDVDVVPFVAHVPDLTLNEASTVVTWGDDEGGLDGAVTARRLGAFRLAQSGGSLELVYGDVVLDSFAYGDGAAPDSWQGANVEATRIPGRVFLRAWDAAGFVDTDAAVDWERPRIHRQHQVDHATRWFDVAGPVRVFVCPDRCLEEVVLRVDAAVSSLDVNLYELTLFEAVDALARAAERGVVVRVVIDERPVGATGARMDRVADAVDRLTGAGADVRALGRERFDVNHAKYLVVDDEWTVVLTENAVQRGWPVDGATGNRGHGVAVRDAPLAAWTRALFEADALHAADARIVTGRELHPDAQSVTRSAFIAPVAPNRLPTLVLAGGFPVAPILAPDHLSDSVRHPVAELIASSRAEVGLQQMNLPMEWRRAGHAVDSPLIGALAAAADRGLWVNGTLAGAFVEPGRDGNDVTAAALTAYAPRMDVRLADAPHPEGVLHAKTWWGDADRAGGWLVVGSANGNLASQALNRELSLVVAHPEAAAYVATVAALDHARAEASSWLLPDGKQPGEVHPGGQPVPGPAVFVWLALIVVALAGSRCVRR